MTGSDVACRRVLVVEDRAHHPGGHFPNRFAELATGFAALGCDVAVLTSRGWYFEHDREAPFALHRYGALARAFDHLAQTMRTASRPVRVRGWVRRGAESLRTIVMIAAARARRRRMGRDTVVVIVSDSDAPALAAVLAGDGDWLHYVYFPPRLPSTRVGALAERLAIRAAARAESRRRRRGGRCVVAAPSAQLRDAWSAAVPALPAATVDLAGVGETTRAPDARIALGIAPSVRVALLFGSVYPEKDPAPVFAAFATLPGWELIVAGTLADARPRDSHVRAFPGFVDDDTRTRLFSAAHLAILSFVPGFDRNSGVLTDAIRWGVPVVCSNRCAPADVVREYALGTTFTAGDAASLADAVRAAPSAIASGDLARARAELSNRAIAQHALEALDVNR